MNISHTIKGDGDKIQHIGSEILLCYRFPINCNFSISHFGVRMETQYKHSLQIFNSFSYLIEQMIEIQSIFLLPNTMFQKSNPIICKDLADILYSVLVNIRMTERESVRETNDQMCVETLLCAYGRLFLSCFIFKIILNNVLFQTRR